MKLGITVYNSRVAPRFDTSGKLLVLELDGNREEVRTELELDKDNISRKIKRIREEGVSTLVCGAITNYELLIVKRQDINVIGGITGEVVEILKWLLNEKWLPRSYFWDPSQCKGLGWRWQIGAQADNKGTFGRGDCRTWQAIQCRCSSCGAKVPHKARRPCRDMACPLCGGPMMVDR